MTAKRLRFLLFSLLALILLVLLDALTKHLAVLYLSGSDGIDIIPGVFRLVYLENTGAAFGILRGMKWFFVVLTIVICAAIVRILVKMPLEKRFYPFACDLVVLLAGAIGNFIDRIRLGYVVDFFYFSLINFPIFNVADIYVTMSVLVLFILILKGEDYEELF